MRLCGWVQGCGWGCPVAVAAECDRAIGWWDNLGAIGLPRSFLLGLAYRKV